MSQQAIKLAKKCIETEDPYLNLGNCGLTDNDVAEGTELDLLLRRCTHLMTIIWSSKWLERYEKFGWGKKQARVFKSDLKLDKNFHIYTHGNRDMIEQGDDKDRRKYYKIYYDQES